MEIKKIIEKYTKSLVLMMDFPEKEYAFTSTFENAQKMDRDFVFILLMPFKKLYNDFEKVCNNKHCKGFIFNKGVLNENDNLTKFHIFMKEINFTPEVFILAQNSYDIAAYIANENSKKENLETITIVGTDGTSTIKDILVHNLSKKFNISYLKDDCLMWQRIFEPLLVVDDNTKYAIVDSYIEAKKMINFSNCSYHNNVIYARPVIHNVNFIEDLEDFGDYYLQAINKKERLKSIFTYEEDNLITDKISFKYSDITHRVPNDKNFKDKNYVIANAFLKYLNIEPDYTDFKESNPLYKEIKINDCNYFILNPKRVTYDNIIKTIDIFNSKYQNEPFSIVYEHIIHLSSFKNDLSMQLHKKFAQINPKMVFLINTSQHINVIKKINKNIYIKNMVVNENDKNEIVNYKKAIKDMAKNIKITYIAVKDEYMSLFEEND